MSRWRKILCTGMVIVAMAVTAVPAAADSNRGKGGKHKGKLDAALSERIGKLGWSRAIVTLKRGADITSEVRKLGGKRLRTLRLIDAEVVELPNAHLKKLADRSEVVRMDDDRPTQAHLAMVSNIVGARAVSASYGLRGAGVGVAVIDSGITNWHDDLTPSGTANERAINNQRVSAFVDFVNGATQPYDDNGHGTHVSGVIAGLGVDSNYNRLGIAPLAHIVSLKVLDAHGRGVISNVIAAMEFVIANRAAHNIRVINLSVGAAVTTSYTVDPLTLAAKRAVEAGIVVVTASGNLGRNPLTGQTQYGGITAPGNAPWVLTVGASDHNGTLRRNDDTVATFSSRGPTAIDHIAKPDIVAPGTGVISLAAVGSTLYTTKPLALVTGSSLLAYKPYITLSGTSMAAPVVAGSVALMLEANPDLTPNLVKAILQYTAEAKTGIDYMSQGGGFLNTKGAVDLARYFKLASAGQRYPYHPEWARKFNWGNRRLGRGAISPVANAWDLDTVWGAAFDAEGENVVWGTACDSVDCSNVVWGSFLEDGENVVWGTMDYDGDNVVWGTFYDGENVVWGTFEYEGENVVWGTFARDGENVVWGTACGGDDCFNVVWGTFDFGGDNVVWGTFAGDGENVVWGTSGDISNDIWATSDDLETVQWDLTNEALVISDPESFDRLFEPPPPSAPVGLIESPVVLISGLS